MFDTVNTYLHIPLVPSLFPSCTPTSPPEHPVHQCSKRSPQSTIVNPSSSHIQPSSLSSTLFLAPFGFPMPTSKCCKSLYLSLSLSYTRSINLFTFYIYCTPYRLSKLDKSIRFFFFTGLEFGCYHNFFPFKCFLFWRRELLLLDFLAYTLQWFCFCIGWDGSISQFTLYPPVISFRYKYQYTSIHTSTL